MSKPKSAEVYRKNFLPLESDPEVFNDLLGDIVGAPRSLSFQDVVSLDDPTLLPRQALALILILPTGDKYEAQKAIEDEDLEDYQCAGNDQGVIWFKQTINNACGMYAILHALSNGEARKMIKPESMLARVLNSCTSLSPHQQSLVLEDCEELESAYKRVALHSSSNAPVDDMSLHYVCFIRSQTDGRLYELDGDRPGPVDRGSAPSLLSPEGLGIIRDYMKLEAGNINFGLMALCSEEQATQ